MLSSENNLDRDLSEHEDNYKSEYKKLYGYLQAKEARVIEIEQQLRQLIKQYKQLPELYAQYIEKILLISEHGLIIYIYF